jgi:ABC-type bacteriocin/lantibiotic exporter with double-glycine peptidase domain
VEPEEKSDEYKQLGEYSDSDVIPVPKNWPSTGEVEFRNVTIKYDVDGPEILKNINLKFGAGERVAICGRTGSGKSTVSRLPFFGRRIRVNQKFSNSA